MAVEFVGMDVCVKFGDSKTNDCLVVRSGHFVMDERTSDGGHGNRQKHVRRFA